MYLIWSNGGAPGRLSDRALRRSGISTRYVALHMPHRSFSIVSYSSWRADEYRNGKKFGTLHIFQGAIVWVPRDRRYGCRVNWEKLDDLMREHGKKRRA